jgi:hypothetical protein
MSSVTEKQRELQHLIVSTFPNLTNRETFASFVIERFSRMSEPTGENYIEMIVLGSTSGLGGGRSRKPGNIRLNWRRLFEDTPEHILTIVGAATSNYLIPFAALVVWNKVLGLSKIEIAESHAMIIAALWDLRDKDNYVNGGGLLTTINTHIRRTTKREFTQKELDQILTELSKMKAIEFTKEGNIWLCEWVQKPYY